jgi:hypothetical protein
MNSFAYVLSISREATAEGIRMISEFMNAEGSSEV